MVQWMTGQARIAYPQSLGVYSSKLAHILQLEPYTHMKTLYMYISLRMSTYPFSGVELGKQLSLILERCDMYTRG